jgi:hypothetical protein
VHRRKENQTENVYRIHENRIDKKVERENKSENLKMDTTAGKKKGMQGRAKNRRKIIR